MTLLMVLCVIVIFAVSIYLILGRELKSIAMGVFLFSHGANLGILAMSGQPLYRNEAGTMLLKEAPILGAGEHLVDPLPQALILTSIVISFAVMAFLLTLLVTTYRQTETIVVDELALEDRPEAPVPLM